MECRHYFYVKSPYTVIQAHPGINGDGNAFFLSVQDSSRYSNELPYIIFDGLLDVPET